MSTPSDTRTAATERNWPVCEKCGGRRFTGGAKRPTPHGVHFWRAPDGSLVKVDCVGDEVR